MERWKGGRMEGGEKDGRNGCHHVAYYSTLGIWIIIVVIVTVVIVVGSLSLRFLT